MISENCSDSNVHREVQEHDQVLQYFLSHWVLAVDSATKEPGKPFKIWVALLAIRRASIMAN